MAATEPTVSVTPVYDRLTELTAFDETKAGVKALVDAGIQEIPRIFVNPQPDSVPKSTMPFEIPVVDLGSTDRASTVEKIRDAAGTLGLFQVVNHGIPVSVMNGVLQGVRRFHDQDVEVKKQYYTRDPFKPVVYNANFDLYSSQSANWRDSYYSIMAPSPPPPEELPEVCRDIQIEYSNQVLKLGGVLFGLLSEALKLNTNYLSDLDCDKALTFVGHCYPACPQPDLTMGSTKHTDDGFLTVLLQDEIGGLQIVHNQQWVDVPPTPGALVVNIGDVLQMMSNDKLKSVEHRVVANKRGPRVSVACFFDIGTSLEPSTKDKVYGPIKELVSEENPARYKETSVYDHILYSISYGLEDATHLQHLKL